MATPKSSKKPSTNPVRTKKPTKKEIAMAIERTKNKAEEYARDPVKAKQLLDEAIKKAKGFERSRGPIADVWGYLTALFRLLKAYTHRVSRYTVGLHSACDSSDPLLFIAN